MWQLLPYTKKYRKELILGPLFKLFEAILELLLPLYMAQLLDQTIQQKQSLITWQLTGKMFLISCLGLFFVIICQYYASVASQGFGTELRNQFFKKLNTLSFKELDQLNQSSLLTRMTNDTTQVQLALAMFIRLVIRAPFLCIGSIIMAYRIEPKLTLIFVGILPLFIGILFIISKKTVPMYQRLQQLLDQLSQQLLENLTGIRVIRAFSNTDQQLKQMEDTNQQLTSSAIKVANLASILAPLTNLMINTAILFLLFFGATSIDNGTLLQGEMIALINYMTQMLLALIVISNLVVIFSKAQASAKRIRAILMIEEANNELEHHSSLNEPIQKIIFDHVSFRYPTTKTDALSKISFQLKTGQTLGITGPTGSGKSTLIPLLTASYSIDKGQILVNNQSIDTINPKSILPGIAVVPQKAVLFSGTIRSNLLMNNPNATDKELWQALEIAQCLDFVKQLPKQLDAMIQAGGKNFSGGQKQRLCIARALVKPCELLIFDDSFSALDYQTDRALRAALKKHLDQQLVIIISQRLSSIAEADQIIVLDEGQMVGHGTHEQLLAHHSLYRNLAQTQGIGGRNKDVKKENFNSLS